MRGPTIHGPVGDLPEGWWSAGLTGGERTGTDRPIWVGVVERGVAEAPGRPADPPAATGDDLAGLAWPLRPFALGAAEDLNSGLAALGRADVLSPNTITEEFTGRLATRLGQLAARTLVLSLYDARNGGLLTGKTSRERFLDFLRRTGTPSGLAALCTEFPVLARLVGQACASAVGSETEVVQRFVTDRDVVVTELFDGRDPGRLVAVRSGAGDRHRGGRSVATLIFDSGNAVMYKPRPGALALHFAGLLGWLGETLPWFAPRTVATVDRGAYCWTERVTARECTEPAQISLFYRRLGVQLALSYATNCSDLHHENLIAVADQPVVVDVETLFHPDSRPVPFSGPDPALTRLAGSVQRTLLLPSTLVGEHGALDISGMGGDGGTMFPTDRVGWADAGLDTMRLARGPGTFTGTDNRPRLAGRVVEPTEHVADLLAGFGAGYRAIVGRKGDFLDLARSCAGAEIRVIARATATYRTVLDESTHPDVLRDAEERDRLFDLLALDGTDPLSRSVVEYERAELWAGDVPLFLGTPESTDLRSGTGEPIPDALPESGLAAVTTKVTGLGDDDLRTQEWLIRAAFAARTGPVVHRAVVGRAGPGSGSAVDPGRLLAAAGDIAERIMSTALWDGDRANWLGLTALAGRHWQVLPLGAGLGDGYGGVALFLAQYGRLAGHPEALRVAGAALRPVPLLLDALSADRELAGVVGYGGFFGLGGIAYALARLGILLDDAEPAGWSAQAVAVIDALARTDTAAPEDDSVATGLAGGVAALAAVHAATGRTEAGTVAKTLADRLTSQAPRPAGPGLLYGQDGRDWALARWSRHPPAARTDPGTEDPGWCSGIAGRLATGMLRDDTGWPARLTGLPPLAEMSLCHGELGLLEALTVLGEPAAAVLAQRTSALIDSIDRDGWRCGTPHAVPSPGLLTGLAGIGYGLLRLAFPAEVPSVLLLAA